MRHCATNRKVSGSFPDAVTGIFNCYNPSGRTMVLRLTQPPTEMTTRNISWGQRWLVRRADNVTTVMCRLSRNLGSSKSWNCNSCNRTVQGLLYLNFSKAILFLQSSGSHYWPYSPRDGHTKFPVGHSNS